jgi:potassium voltage-gated channel Eag-related subfamily H member 5
VSLLEQIEISATKSSIVNSRKVADVRREKELAERRKNEPQLGSSQDHLVRKIFSKFRRAQQTAQLTKDSSQNSDVEKGDTDQESKKVGENAITWRFNEVSEMGKSCGNSADELSYFPLQINLISMKLFHLFQLPAKLTLTEDSRVVTSVPSPSQSPSPSTGQISGASKLRGGSKWGRLLGSSSVDSASDSSAKVAVSRSLSARESLRESAQARSNNAPSSNNGGQGNKVRELIELCDSIDIETFQGFSEIRQAFSRASISHPPRHN